MQRGKVHNNAGYVTAANKLKMRRTSLVLVVCAKKGKLAAIAREGAEEKECR